MDVGPHGKQHVAARRRPFHPHTLANIQTCSCTDTEEVWMRGIYTVTDNENRYLHKGLHLVSLRWQWWGEGWPVNMKRYTLSQCVRLAARRRNAVHTLSLGSKMNGCHRNRQWVSLGVRLGREMRVGWEGLRGGVWGLRMRTGAVRLLLINRHSQTSCGHLIKQTSLCSSCWHNTFIPHLLPRNESADHRREKRMNFGSVRCKVYGITHSTQ